MKKTLFYILAVIFFLYGIGKRIVQGIRSLLPKKKVTPVAAEGEVLLFEDEGNETITAPPSKGSVWANRMKAGASQVPPEDLPKIVLVTLLLVGFELFGIYNFIYWGTVYAWLGGFEVCAAAFITGWLLFKFSKSFFPPIWEEAVQQATFLIFNS